MEVLLFSLFNGLLYGMLLFLLSSGLTLIFSMMGVLNFAHASFYMLGAYLAYTISKYAGFVPALILAPLIVGMFGALVEKYGLRRVHRFGHVAELLFTFGLAFLFVEIVQVIWGKIPVAYHVPDMLNFPAFKWQGLEYSAYRIFMLAISASIFIALYGMLKFTRVGLVIQAALSHPRMVGALGHNVEKVFMYTFGFGCALAGVAGVIGGNVLGTEPAMAEQLGPIVFVVIVIGGLGSLGGALVASIFIGILDNLSNSFALPAAPLFAVFGITADQGGIWADLANITTANIAPVLPYFMLVLILIFRPRGLFGNRDV